jgi:hypothetical protein
MFKVAWTSGEDAAWGETWKLVVVRDEDGTFGM